MIYYKKLLFINTGLRSQVIFYFFVWKDEMEMHVDWTLGLNWLWFDQDIYLFLNGINSIETDISKPVQYKLPTPNKNRKMQWRRNVF